MLGFGAVGEFAVGEAWRDRITDLPPLSVSAILTELGSKSPAGQAVRVFPDVWRAILAELSSDPSIAYQIPARRWEEIVASAFERNGFDEVILTPASGDHGRDIIALKRGIISINIIGSVKAYAPNNPVRYDEIRALLGVLSGERDASKGLITTTSSFPTNLERDPFIGPFLPTRLQLVSGAELIPWLRALSAA